VAWSRVAFPSRNADLLCVSLAAGARGISPEARIAPTTRVVGDPEMAHQVQLAVRRDGTLDAVWQDLTPQRALRHAYSTNGATSFSRPVVVADEDSQGPGSPPSLAAAPDGRLLLAWSNAKGVFAASFRAGGWSKPVRVLVPDSNVEFYNPTVAVAEDAAWLLAYRLEAREGRVSVLLQRSDDGGRAWAEHCILATRTLDPKRVRAFMPGHYVGLAAAKGRAYAAYVLPNDGDRGYGRTYELRVSRVE
jgi:hypothetical protein